MRSTLRRTLIVLATLIALASISLTASPADSDLTETHKRIQKAIKRLPYYSLFDNITFSVEQGTVTLSGKVRQATLKSGAEAAVLRLEEVLEVDNQIEILPVSNYDDRLRLATARAIYSNNFLNRYAAGVHPSIRIIVERGRVTLEGVVRNKTHRNVAEIEARSVAGAFDIQNNLEWETS